MVEGRGNLAFASFFPMEGDGKAVHLILDIFQQMEKGSALLDAERLRRKTKQYFRRAVAVVLGKSHNGNLQVQLVFYHLPYHFHLSFSSIRQNEVGQFALLFQNTAVAAAYHLLHGGIIVRSHHRFDKVFPVVFFAGFGFLEHHAGSHCIRALNVGVIKTLNVVRHFLQL